MKRMLALVALVAALGAGCHETPAPPTTPDPAAMDTAAPPSLGGGGAGLSTMGGPTALVVEGSISLYRYSASENDQRRGTHRYDISLRWPQAPNARSGDFYFYRVKADETGVRGGKVDYPDTSVGIGPDEQARKPWLTENGIRLPPNADICAYARHRRRSRSLRYMDLGCTRTGAAPRPYVEPPPPPSTETGGTCQQGSLRTSEVESQVTCEIAWIRANACVDFFILAGQGSARDACCRAVNATINTTNYGTNTACLLPGFESPR